MRAFLFIFFLFVSIVCIPNWVYREDHKTEEAGDRAESIQEQIGLANNRLRILKAEWAYLNRPERLKVLIAMNHGKLGLYPYTSENFGEIQDIPFYREKIFVAQNDNFENDGKLP